MGRIVRRWLVSPARCTQSEDLLTLLEQLRDTVPAQARSDSSGWRRFRRWATLLNPRFGEPPSVVEAAESENATSTGRPSWTEWRTIRSAIGHVGTRATDPGYPARLKRIGRKTGLSTKGVLGTLHYAGPRELRSLVFAASVAQSQVGETGSAMERALAECDREEFIGWVRALAAIDATGKNFLLEHVRSQALFRRNAGLPHSVDIEVIGAHPVRAQEPCHLIEILVTRSNEAMPFADFSQSTKRHQFTSTQVAWREGLLDRETGEPVPMKDPLPPGPIRTAFFLHHLDFERPIETPYGLLDLPDPTPRPKRLKAIRYQAPG